MPDNLALRMRPKTIDQVIGQEHLVGPGKIIRRMVEANRLSSMILYGPPPSKIFSCLYWRAVWSS